MSSNYIVQKCSGDVCLNINCDGENQTCTMEECDENGENCKQKPDCDYDLYCTRGVLKKDDPENINVWLWLGLGIILIVIVIVIGIFLYHKTPENYPIGFEYGRQIDPSSFQHQSQY